MVCPTEDAGQTEMKGCIHLYTGDGKGKTTAALGLALRAAGAGIRVYIAQFLKGKRYSEDKALAHLRPAVTVKKFGSQATAWWPTVHSAIAGSGVGVPHVWPSAE